MNGPSLPGGPPGRAAKSRRVFGAAIAVITAVTGIVVAVPMTAGAAVSGAQVSSAASGLTVPKLAWKSCQGGFQCATAHVPLDYRHPRGAAISIAVIRHLATDPAHRIGSLFLNTGGLGEQDDAFPAAYATFPASLQERYDITTFDPRGSGHSTAVRCFPSVTAENAFFAALPPFPVGAAQEAAWERTYARFDALCAAHNGSLLDHDTTGDVARDMDLIRQAAGDPVLNYFGLSSGTIIGITYANLFPGKVGHMVLDGNLNPITFTSSDHTLPVFLRLGTDKASAATMNGFLTLCGQAATSGCAFSAGSPAATRAKWNKLLSRLLRHPVSAGSPLQSFTYADVIASLPVRFVSDWQQGAVLLQQIWTASAGGGPATTVKGNLPATAGNALPATAPAYTGQEQMDAALCSDTANPGNPGDYPAIARFAAARSGGFGLEYTWLFEACAQWPGHGASDRYTGPWNRPTASTILVVGNTGDPATPYQDSVAAARDLARARLLTVDGFGHTAASNGSTCAINYEIGNLLTGALPAVGTVCKEDAPPFPAP